MWREFQLVKLQSIFLLLLLFASFSSVYQPLSNLVLSQEKGWVNSPDNVSGKFLDYHLVNNRIESRNQIMYAPSDLLVLTIVSCITNIPQQEYQVHEPQHQYIARCPSQLCRSQRRLRFASVASAFHGYQSNPPECIWEVLNEIWLNYMMKRRPSLSLTDSSSEMNTEG